MYARQDGRRSTGLQSKTEEQIGQETGAESRENGEGLTRWLLKANVVIYIIPKGNSVSSAERVTGIHHGTILIMQLIKSTSKKLHALFVGTLIVKLITVIIPSL